MLIYFENYITGQALDRQRCMIPKAPQSEYSEAISAELKTLAGTLSLCTLLFSILRTNTDEKRWFYIIPLPYSSGEIWSFRKKRCVYLVTHVFMCSFADVCGHESLLRGSLHALQCDASLPRLVRFLQSVWHLQRCSTLSWMFVSQLLPFFSAICNRCQWLCPMYPLNLQPYHYLVCWNMKWSKRTAQRRSWVVFNEKGKTTSFVNFGCWNVNLHGKHCRSHELKHTDSACTPHNCTYNTRQSACVCVWHFFMATWLYVLGTH